MLIRVKIKKSHCKFVTYTYTCTATGCRPNTYAAVRFDEGNGVDTGCFRQGKMYRSPREGFDRILFFPIDCLCMSVLMSECENISPVCRNLALYRFLFASLDHWTVLVIVFGTRHYDTLCLHVHSGYIMSCIYIHGALCRV
jgi:hypothetical protein